MPHQITNIFFDLDHTLWDFDKNSTETLEFLFYKHNFGELHQIESTDFIHQYHVANRELWELFNYNKIDKHELRELRLQYTFSRLGIDIKHIPASFNDEYIHICPQKGNLFPHAIEILTHFSNQFHLHILSNGFAEIQDIKIKTSGIEPFFKNIFTADVIGHKKPDKAFYEYVLNELNVSASECIMIGDTLDADVIGAMNAGIKAVYFNPHKMEHNAIVNHEICSLIELKNLF